MADNTIAGIALIGLSVIALFNELPYTAVRLAGIMAGMIVMFGGLCAGMWARRGQVSSCSQFP